MNMCLASMVLTMHISCLPTNIACYDYSCLLCSLLHLCTQGFIKETGGAHPLDNLLITHKL